MTTSLATVHAESLPGDRPAELGVLGSILRDPEVAMPKAVALLAAEDFGDVACQEVYRAMLRLLHKGRSIDTLSLISDLRANGKPTNITGIDGSLDDYVIDLSYLVPSATNIEGYASRVRETSMQRRLIQTAGRLAQDASTPGAEPAQIINETMHALAILAESGAATSNLVRLADAVTRNHAALGGDVGKIPPSIPWPFETINRFSLGGHCAGDLWVLGGDEGGGKSTLTYNVLLHVARLGCRVLLVSYEISQFQLGPLFTAVGTGLVYSSVKPNRRLQHETGRTQLDLMGQQKRNTLETFLQQADALDVDLLTGYPDLTEIGAVLARAKAQGRPYDYVAVDHLHLMPLDRHVRRDSGLEAQIRGNANGCKELAQRYETSVLLLCQYKDNRDYDEPPTINDLKGSSAIKQAASLALMIWIDPENRDRKQAGDREILAKLCMPKNREGQDTRYVPLAWELAERRMTEVEE